MAIWMVIPAIIGGIIAISGKIISNERRNAAIDEAIGIGRMNLIEGQNMTDMNSKLLLQDTVAILGTSGVSAEEGTAMQFQDNIRMTKEATVNKMSRDFDQWVNNLETEKETGNINTAFSVASDVIGMASNVAYDLFRSGAFDPSGADMSVEPSPGTVGNYYKTSYGGTPQGYVPTGAGIARGAIDLSMPQMGGLSGPSTFGRFSLQGF